MVFKKLYFLMGLLVGLCGFAQPNFSLVGFATQNGGTKGGQGGTTVTATTYTQLKSYAESANTYVIMVQGTISNGTAGGQIRINSNKSIIGVGTTAFLSGVGLDVSSKNNVILQNLKITLVGTSSPKDINGGDCVSISGTSKNIWIDHCEIYSENPDEQTNIDKYDGLLDIKGQTGFITISWCYLHDHHKGGLVGAADDDLYDDRKVTLHHNHYNKVKLRVPMYRGSVGHFFNNYIKDAKDASEIRAGACVRIEKNYYENFNYAIYTPSDAKGNTERIDNYLNKTQSRAFPGSCTADIPYNYAAVLTTNTADVKTLVTQYAGVGKISANTNLAPTVGITAPSNNTSYTAPATIGLSANATDSDGTIAKVEFYNGNALLSSDNSSPYAYNWNNVPAGTYTITAVATDNDGATKTSSSVTLIVKAAPQQAILTKQGAGSSNQTVTIGTAIVGYSFTWDYANTVVVSGMPKGIVVDINNGDKLVSISGTPTQVGVFNFTVSTVGGSPDSTRKGSITVNDVTTYINSELLTHDWLVYPNPSDGSITIQKPHSEATVKAYNTTGQIILDTPFQNKIELGENLPVGIYILCITEGEQSHMIRVVKK